MAYGPRVAFITNEMDVFRVSSIEERVSSPMSQKNCSVISPLLLTSCLDRRALTLSRRRKTTTAEGDA